MVNSRVGGTAEEQVGGTGRSPCAVKESRESRDRHCSYSQGRSQGTGVAVSGSDDRWELRADLPLDLPVGGTELSGTRGCAGRLSVTRPSGFGQ